MHFIGKEDYRSREKEQREIRMLNKESSWQSVNSVSYRDSMDCEKNAVIGHDFVGNIGYLQALKYDLLTLTAKHSM